MINEIIEQYAEETFLKADGFDKAIIGVEENGSYMGEKTPIWCEDNFEL